MKWGGFICRFKDVDFRIREVQARRSYLFLDISFDNFKFSVYETVFGNFYEVPLGRLINRIRIFFRLTPMGTSQKTEDVEKIETRANLIAIRNFAAEQALKQRRANWHGKKKQEILQHIIYGAVLADRDI